MSETAPRPLRQETINRPKRAEGRLRGLVEMPEARRPCLVVVRPWQARQKAVAQAGKALVHMRRATELIACDGHGAARPPGEVPRC